ncbi:glycosyltransferase [Nitrobacter sp. Nb-311A]|uniref:glycosyltransferase n=1 Tax=Nitrobacter sp. Nb-311A TaxID=314253 RepID=UPI0009FC5411
MTGNDRSLRAKVLGSLGLAQNVGSDVVSKISEYGIGARFHLLGPTRDISAAYSAFDVLAFPSHLKAAGRPVFEAAFAGRPSIVAVENPKPDTLVHGETGLSIPESLLRQSRRRSATSLITERYP